MGETATAGPGAAAYAYTISRDGHDDIEEADTLGRMTNNQAEYTALVRALEHALELGDEFRVVVHSDSELMVKQVKGEYRVKNEELRPLYELARELCDDFKGGVELVHVRRGANVRADALCNEALDGKRSAMPRAGTVPGAKQKPAGATRPASTSRTPRGPHPRSIALCPGLSPTRSSSTALSAASSSA